MSTAARCLATLLWLLLSSAAAAQTPAVPEQQITDLDQLLQAVRDNQRLEAARNREREQQFLGARDRQQALLKQARREFERAQQDNNPLIKVTEGNSRRIETLREQLDERKQEMGDIYSTFSEMTGDFTAVLKSSMISAQMPERTARLEQLARSEQLASMADLESLWLLVQEEMTESAKISTFEAAVVDLGGSQEQRQVLRAGTFTAFADGSFLRFIPETGELLQLARQPAARHQRAAADFAASAGTLQPMVIDPTGGSLLGMMIHTPSLRERIEQGGVIGYIILGIGVLGLILTAWRVAYLGWIGLAIRRQLADISSPSERNPLGRVLLGASQEQASEYADGEMIQYRLDEAVLAEIPALERSHSLIKLLAATSPLLGLLGTVTGMILTFQAISLFGSGDPKLMAGGISQALVTTVLGLVVAIPLLFGHGLVASLARNTIQRLDEQSAGLMARLIEQQSGPP